VSVSLLEDVGRAVASRQRALAEVSDVQLMVVALEKRLGGM
jgi:hypothetical protein